MSKGSKRRQGNNKAYRDNWDKIFKKKKDLEEEFTKAKEKEEVMLNYTGGKCSTS